MNDNCSDIRVTVCTGIAAEALTGTDTRQLSSATGGRQLVRNTVWNLIGHGVPLLVALFAIPVLIRGLGTERFGVLSLIWMIVGYFTLFDLGIGRATTKFVAENIARQETDALSQLVWTSLGMLFCLGLTGTFLLGLLSPFLLSRFFTIPAYLGAETSRAFYLIAMAIPLVLGTAGTRGILEAQQRFALINAIKIPVSSLFFAAPLLVLVYSNSLYPITAALIGTRLIEFSLYAFFCIRSIPGMRHPHWPNQAFVKKLFGFGGWLTVTNIVGPLMTYMDRFIIGGILSMSAVAYYATPYDFVARLAVIPGSLLGVMFPALTAAYALNMSRFTFLYDRTVTSILCVMTPLVLLVTLLARPFLTVWLGAEFAVQSTLVLQLLAVGTLINSLGQVPFSAIQAMGRPDITAKLHLMELPLYLGMIWFFAHTMGIVGAALAGLIRVLIDTIVLNRLANRLMRDR
jgi:O-antigen/teichoic acid export membrane protein